jgi:hypothetical protein
VDAVDIDAGTLHVLGVRYFIVSNITELEDGMPAVGDYVEVEDDNGDGTADTVEIED